MKKMQKRCTPAADIIHTTMDTKVQQAMETVYNNDANFPNRDVQSAMIVTEPDTGEIRGIVRRTASEICP